MSETPNYGEERSRAVTEALELLALHNWFPNEHESHLPAEHVTAPMLLAGMTAQVINELGFVVQWVKGRSARIKVTSAGPVEQVTVHASWDNPRLPYYSVFTGLMDAIHADISLGGAVAKVDLSKAYTVPSVDHRNEIHSAHIFLDVVHNYLPS